MLSEGKKSYSFGPFILNPVEKLLLCNGLNVPITPKAFDLLSVLIENHGHLVTKQELMNLIWPNSFVEEANLSVKMSELRRLLGEGPNDNRYIETVPRRGYRFVAEVTILNAFENREGVQSVEVTEVAELEENTANPAEGVNRDDGGFSIRIPRVVRYLFVAAGIIVALLVAGNITGYWSFTGARRPATIRTLAVLPVVNLSGDPAQEYFADGVTDSLISGLARINNLRVISRTSVMQYKNGQKTVREIAADLGADAVIEGTVQRSESRFKVNLQLIDARDERHLWSATFESPLGEILGIQDEIARSVAKVVRGSLSKQDEEKFSHPVQVEPKAYDLFLRGRYYLEHQTKADNERAISLLQDAVAADPNFAPAYSALGQACIWRLFLFAPNEKQWEETAYVAIEKAIALDPNLADAHLARGRLLWTPANYFPHVRAIQEYRRAIALNPNLDEARNQLALVYNHVGLLDESLKELEEAVRINPGNSLARYRIGETILFQGRYEDALTYLRGVPPETNPALIGHQIAWALFNLGRHRQAHEVLDDFLKRFPEDHGGLYASMRAVIEAADGNQSEAERAIAVAIEKGRGYGHFHHTAYHIACAYSLMNRPDEAVNWLEDAAKNGFLNYPMYAQDPNFENIRQNERYKKFLETVRKQYEKYQALVKEPV